MNKQFAILHIEKGTGSGGALGNHIDREIGKEHSYINADSEKKGLNIHVIEKDGFLNKLSFDKFTPKALESCVDARILEGHTSGRKIRTDAVKCLQLILSGTHEQMMNIGKYENQFDAWIKANHKFVQEQFGGSKNIVRFTVHMDERTPHIHAVVVPITKDGRLCSKEFMGNRQSLIKLQDAYAEKMELFSLERGVRGSNAQHSTVKDFYGRIEESLKSIEVTPVDQSIADSVITAVNVPAPPFRLNNEKWANETEKEIKAKLENKIKSLEEEHLQRQRKLQNQVVKLQNDLHQEQRRNNSSGLTDLKKEKIKLKFEIEKLKTHKQNLSTEFSLVQTNKKETKL